MLAAHIEDGPRVSSPAVDAASEQHNPTHPPGWRQDVIVAFSLSNLSYLLSWHDVQTSSRKELDYFAARPATHTLEFATVLNVVLLGAFLAAILRRLRCVKGPRYLRAADYFTFLVLMWVAIRALKPVSWVALFGATTARELVALSGRMLNFVGPHGLVVVILVCIVGTTAVVSRFFGPVVQASRAIALVLSPFAVMNFGQVLWNVATSRDNNAFLYRDYRAGQPALRTGRFVWLIFDELDQHFVFQQRPPNVDMREFDRFRLTALCAMRARAPAESTLESLPSLIRGKVVAKAEPVGPNELVLTSSDGTRAMWSREPSIFGDARVLGFRSALAGLFHPYCRVIGKDLDSCFCYLPAEWGGPAVRWKMFADHSGLWKTLAMQARKELLAAHVLKRFDGQSFTTIDREVSIQQRAAHRRCFEEIRRRSLHFVASPELNFVSVHVPVPHDPGIYDRRAAAFSLSEDKNYVDNLALANRFLGEIRQAMQAAGFWDDATVLVTSDHPYRKQHWSREIYWTAEMARLTAGSETSTVPFLLKLPRQKASLTYNPEFNTVVTRRLLGALMRGEIRTPEEAAKWLDRFGAVTPP